MRLEANPQENPCRVNGDFGVASRSRNQGMIQGKKHVQDSQGLLSDA